VELKNLREKLYTMRSQAVTEKVEDVSQFGITRRGIARLLTEQSSRRVGGGEPRTPAKAPVKRAAKPAKKSVAKPTKRAVTAAGKTANKPGAKRAKTTPKRKAKSAK
jgi:ribosomal protein L29